MLTFDDFLPILGEFGPYQKRILLFTCIIVIPTGAHIFAQVFLGARTDHWCSTPPQWKTENCTQWDLDVSQKCEAAKKAVIIPSGSQCSRYDLDYNVVEFHPELNATQYTNGTTECIDGWTYDRSQYTSTIVQQYDLVCERKTLPDLAQSFFAAGFLTGAFVFGWLADWIGRKPAMFIAAVVNGLSGTVLAFSPNLAIYTAIRFVVAASTMGLYFVAFVCVTEYVGPSKRTLVGVLMADAFALGYMILAILAYFVRDWKILQLIISVPLFLELAFIPFFPESARWLLSRGEAHKAKPIIEEAAKYGKVDVPVSMFDDENDNIREKKSDSGVAGGKSPSCIDILRYPKLRCRTFNMMFNWFVNNMVYYGLSLSTASLGGNDFLAAFISAAVEIPGYTSSLFVIEKWGRRVPLCIYLVVSGVAVITTSWLPVGNWRIAIAMIGKLCVSASFGVVYIFAAEIFPTPVRSIGLGACCMASHLSGIITPMILSLSLLVWQPLPFLIFGVAAIIAGALALLFPESMGQPLPETMEDGENFGAEKSKPKSRKAPSKDKDGVDYNPIAMDERKANGLEDGDVKEDTNDSEDNHINV